MTSTPPLVRSFGYVGFETAKLPAWVEFAPKVIGAMIGETLPGGGLALRLDDWSYRLALVPGPAERLAFIGWEVSDAAALTALEDRLVAAGMPLTRGSDEEVRSRRVQGLAWCLDPSGIRTEFFFGAERASVEFAAGRPLSGFVTGDLGLGHLVLQPSDPDATLQFYRDALAFRLTDRLHAHLYFLGCNQRHHSVGVANIGGPARVLHLMLEVGDIDDVGRALDLCIDGGIRASMLGLHSNDRMTSIYITTPSGWEIEYGWQGMLVDSGSWVTETIDRPSVWGHRQLDVDHPPAPRRFQQVIQ
jgi:extradiol dioxygenase